VVSLAGLAAASVLPATGATAATTSGATPGTIVAAAYARMTSAQRIGQLFMVGLPVAGASTSALAVLSRYRVGNVILMGASSAGVASVGRVVGPMRLTATQAAVGPYVAVDQEGGYVQHLKGTGLSTIPTAVRQGQLPAATLQADWTAWAGQLRRAGINLDLAPVADVVPASVGTSNQPIGRWLREYGATPAAVAPKVAAAVRGIQAAGLVATVKHFPGIGRASGNTDLTAGVTDPTRRGDAYLTPFRSAIAAGARIVMMSTAIYPSIDPHNVAAFSHLVTTTMLRQDLGFAGLIVSDSLQAKSVSGYSYATRAIAALDAGVDVLLLTSGAPVPAMTAAISERAAARPSFAAVVKSAVLRVLEAKARAGLISR
jgi:beta-N-acetylhexosaminidase